MLRSVWFAVLLLLHTWHDAHRPEIFYFVLICPEHFPHKVKVSSTWLVVSKWNWLSLSSNTFVVEVWFLHSHLNSAIKYKEVQCIMFKKIICNISDNSLSIFLPRRIEKSAWGISIKIEASCLAGNHNPNKQDGQRMRKERWHTFVSKAFTIQIVNFQQSKKIRSSCIRNVQIYFYAILNTKFKAQSYYFCLKQKSNNIPVFAHHLNTVVFSVISICYADFEE